MNHFGILKSLHDYLIWNAIKSIFQYILQTIHPIISHSVIRLILYNIYCKKEKKSFFTIIYLFIFLRNNTVILLSWRQICLIHFKTKGRNILHQNRKTCDMSCMPSKVMSYIISFSTHMLKFYMSKSISQFICLFYEKAEWSKVWHLIC